MAMAVEPDRQDQEPTRGAKLITAIPWGERKASPHCTRQLLENIEIAQTLTGHDLMSRYELKAANPSCRLIQSGLITSCRLSRSQQTSQTSI